MNTTVFGGDPPLGYWPDPNENTIGTGELSETFRYNVNRYIPLALYGWGTYVSFALDLDTKQFAWSISNGTWGPHHAYLKKYPWPTTSPQENVPAEMTVPAFRGHDWVLSQLMLADGVEEDSPFIAGGLYLKLDGRVEPRFTSGSNRESNGHSVDRVLVPEYADILEKKLRAVAEGRDIVPRSECPYWRLAGQ